MEMVVKVVASYYSGFHDLKIVVSKILYKMTLVLVDRWTVEVIKMWMVYREPCWIQGGTGGLIPPGHTVIPLHLKTSLVICILSILQIL